MKCHYEILNVSREAEETEIKTSYKKLALKWHPDKNLDNPDEAKEQFQLVQQAYEVLSDRQERAWYDNHREQILRGSNKDFEDTSLDVFQYFTTTCFKGYGDDDKGFYATYRKVFEQIAKEDMEYMEEKEEFCDIPVFGCSTSDYEATVGLFYNYWGSYSTKKTYVWLDPYNIKETRDRRYIKLIDKENKKVRAKAKKERNEEIRNLVAFVRKRDRRIQAQLKKIEVKTQENKLKHEEKSKLMKLERRKELCTNTQTEWMKFDNVKSELEEIEKKLAEEYGEELSNSDDEDESFEDLENLYCVACNKIFKTPKAFENHESSKKHRDNVEKLKENMLEEDEEFLESYEEGDLIEQDLLSEEADEEIICTDDDLDLSEIEEEVRLPTPTKSKKKKKNKKINPKPPTLIDEEAIETNKEEALPMTQSEDVNKSKKQRRKSKLIKPQIEEINENNIEAINTKKSNTNKSKTNKSNANKSDESDSTDEKINEARAKKTNTNKCKTNKSNANKSDESDSTDEKINEARAKKTNTNKCKTNKSNANKSDESDSTDEKINEARAKKTNTNKCKTNKSNANKSDESDSTDEKINEARAKKTNKRKLKKTLKTKQVDIEEILETIDKDHCCVICQINFNSKNKLFDHLKKTGHSVHLPGTLTGKSEPVKTKKKSVRDR